MWKPACWCRSTTLPAAPVRKVKTTGTQIKVTPVRYCGAVPRLREMCSRALQLRFGESPPASSATRDLRGPWVRPPPGATAGHRHRPRCAPLAARPFPRPLPLWRQAAKETEAAARWAASSPAATLTGTLPGPGPRMGPSAELRAQRRRGRGCGGCGWCRFQALLGRSPAVPSHTFPSLASPAH